jgi:hypothetical protein
MLDITERDPAPRHVVLGSWGIDAVVARLESIRSEVEAWREAGASTDYPKS